MNRITANRLLREELIRYEQLGCAQLVEMFDEEFSEIRIAPGEVPYSVQVAVCKNQNGEIVIKGSITPADPGSPFDRLDDFILVAMNRGEEEA